MRFDQVLCGDCNKVLKKLENNSVDLVFTSPPYAEQRKATYGGIKGEKYVNWFNPIGEELFRVLKPTGSFVLNIKEVALNGERQTYVIELILSLRQQGWLWTEEYIWHKKNSFPGKWPNRFRDSWERLLHFTKSKKFNMYQENVMIPIGNWAGYRLNNLSKKDNERDESRAGSGFGKRVANWKGRDLVYPTNVVVGATESSYKNHSAAFPEYLPSWFIKLFTAENDLVLDPFLGSGTTAVAAKKLNRRYLGIEINPEYCASAKSRLKKTSFVESANQ